MTKLRKLNVVWVQFCDVVKVANDPQEDLAADLAMKVRKLKHPRTILLATYLNCVKKFGNFSEILMEFMVGY
jgi:hypothetical protein